MSIYLYELERWREHQSRVTSFLNILNKNKNNIKNSDKYICKLLELNDNFNNIENIIEEIKYECIYPSSKFKDNEKIKTKINEHLKLKKMAKILAVNSIYLH